MLLTTHHVAHLTWQNTLHFCSSVMQIRWVPYLDMRQHTCVAHWYCNSLCIFHSKTRSDCPHRQHVRKGVANYSEEVPTISKVLKGTINSGCERTKKGLLHQTLHNHLCVIVFAAQVHTSAFVQYGHALPPLPPCFSATDNVLPSTCKPFIDSMAAVAPSGLEKSTKPNPLLEPSGCLAMLQDTTMPHAEKCRASSASLQELGRWNI